MCTHMAFLNIHSFGTIQFLYFYLGCNFVPSKLHPVRSPLLQLKSTLLLDLFFFSKFRHDLLIARVCTVEGVDCYYEICCIILSSSDKSKATNMVCRTAVINWVSWGITMQGNCSNLEGGVSHVLRLTREFTWEITMQGNCSNLEERGLSMPAGHHQGNHRGNHRAVTLQH